MLHVKVLSTQTSFISEPPADIQQEFAFPSKLGRSSLGYAVDLEGEVRAFARKTLGFEDHGSLFNGAHNR